MALALASKTVVLMGPVGNDGKAAAVGLGPGVKLWPWSTGGVDSTVDFWPSQERLGLGGSWSSEREELSTEAACWGKKGLSS